MIQQKTLIVENKTLAPGYHQLRLMAPEIAASAQPGQFIQIRVADSDCTDPLLARPISIYRIAATQGWIEVVYKKVGRGTELLAKKVQGDLLEVFGPMGTGFQIPQNVQRLGLVGGGVGMPPLYCLAERLHTARPELPITLFYGGRSQNDLLGLTLWEQLGVQTYLATEDGSYGAKGLVTAALTEQLRQGACDYLAACGPTPMLKAVRQLALAYQIPGAVSLEAHMACGVGACLGCTCQTEHGYRRVCVDGPVFDVNEVVLP